MSSGPIEAEASDREARQIIPGSDAFAPPSRWSHRLLPRAPRPLPFPKCPPSPSPSPIYSPSPRTPLCTRPPNQTVPSFPLPFRFSRLVHSIQLISLSLEEARQEDEEEEDDGVVGVATGQAVAALHQERGSPRRRVCGSRPLAPGSDGGVAGLSDAERFLFVRAGAFLTSLAPTVKASTSRWRSSSSARPKAMGCCSRRFAESALFFPCQR